MSNEPREDPGATWDDLGCTLMGLLLLAIVVAAVLEVLGGMR